jgi:hypothetical protein
VALGHVLEVDLHPALVDLVAQQRGREVDREAVAYPVVREAGLPLLLGSQRAEPHQRPRALVLEVDDSRQRRR